MIKQSNMSPVFCLEMKNQLPVDLPVLEQVDMIFQEAIFKDISDRNVQSYGFKCRKEVIGKPLAVIWTPECKNHNHIIHKYFQKFVRSGYELFDAEVSGTNQANEDKCWLTNLKGIIENGFLTGIVGFQIDITVNRL